MLPRILETEVMDTPEEARDYDAMDHSGVNRLFVADFLAVWSGQNPILDVGTGTAQIPLELCRQHPSARIVAIDLADHMLQVGRLNVGQASFTNRITLECRDAKTLPYANDSFAAVISNSIVHHIPEPGAVLAEIVRVLSVGGCLLVRDLLRPASAAEVKRLVGLYAADANPHQRQMFDDSLCAALTLEEIRGLIAPLGFAPETVRQTTDRHWTWMARKPASVYNQG
jgi:ubiquinone/menaquinone biosynthesis C-methylase UbiE